MFTFLLISAVVFYVFNKLGYFLASGSHMTGYQGSKTYIALLATNYQKITSTIGIAIISAIVGGIITLII